MRAALRGGEHLAADHAVHHLRHLGGREFRPALCSTANTRPSLALFMLDSVLISVGMTLVVVGVKWVTMGRYEPQVKPMWSFWAMRTEACAVLYWGLAGKVFLDHLRGTPFLPWMLRLFGVEIRQGRVHGHDRHHRIRLRAMSAISCAVNTVCALQTHLYEDRVMKVGRMHLGKGVTVGAGSTVLYDTHSAISRGSGR